MDAEQVRNVNEGEVNRIITGRSLPQYSDDLAGFVGVLRKRVFTSQAKAAAHFDLNRSTVVRYEREELTPPLGYLVCLARLVIDQLKLEETEEITTHQQALLRQVNQAVRYDYRDTPFQNWDELCALADEYLAERRSTPHSVKASSTPIESQNVVASSARLAILPNEAPPPPHFYVERTTLQAALLDKVRHERARILVLWGQGGAGKSTLAAWLAKMTQADFPDGQFWVELSENLSPDETILEAQTQIARSVGGILTGTSLAERAGQLRTLLSQKRCLVVLDNVWATTGLAHLQVVNDESCLVLSTRYRKVADLLETPIIHVNGMAESEGLALLTRWAGYAVTVTELVHRLGGLPLALKLSGVQLRDEGTPAELLAHFQEQHLDLSLLDLDAPENALESLNPCFDRSFNRLTSKEQSYFAQLGCFTGKFESIDSTKIWGISSREAQRLLRHLYKLALLERQGEQFQLHPLLRAYARQKLLVSPIDSQTTYRRYTAYYIRYCLYHPQILDDATTEAPDLDESWPDIVSGVKWAAEYAPQLATIAALLAHTERPALLETIGSPLVKAVETHIAEMVDDTTETAILHELVGDLWLLSGGSEVALSHFAQAANLWLTLGDYLASSRVRLRMAGVHLVHQDSASAQRPVGDKLATAQALQQAQAVLAASLPIAEADLEPARWLFYWFDLIYSVIVKGGELEWLENNVTQFTELAQQTGYPLLQARGWHIKRLFYTSNPSPEIRQKGRSFAAKAAWLWWRHEQKDKALAEVMWTQEQTKTWRSPRMAQHFARRLARATPKLSQEQIGLIENQRIRWWLEADEDERVEWLVRQLPPPGTDDWHALNDILSISTSGERVRHVARGLPRPDEHKVSEPMWKIFTGQRALPLAEEAAAKLIQHYLTILETELGE